MSAVEQDDAELEALRLMCRRLNDLEKEARIRVLVYVVTRFGARDVIESIEADEKRWSRP